jgi:inner membrane protein involved in colicin E2 resistance
MALVHDRFAPLQGKERNRDRFIYCYCYLFIVLQLEDYALIPGSVGLLVILALVMYVTRKINWYEVETVARENEK